MLSPVIKKLLEEKLGKEIRYSSDIEHLSFDIEKYTSQRISVNTLKRLFGLVQGVKEPRLFTLDVIARYLNFKNWDDITDSLSNHGNSSFSSIEEIIIEDLQRGDKIVFGYTPDRLVTLEFVEDKTFTVVESFNSKLLLNDTLIINHFVLNYPLLVNRVIRDGVNLGKFTAGKVSGITSLKIIRK
ncbi:hypothetical protein LJC21_02790 [Bacteroides sp. OttesenSCG-928-E20]|nr:hypothetical protein [Bacteroides sp. OttesenSCG-928-N06]MDL2299616.1 hypothetical protein [Bacteroides sp. OttesenSCG-928-E20]